MPLPDRINVLLVEHQYLVRAGIRTVLSETPDIHLVKEAAELSEGRAAYAEMRPDVLILGLRFPDSCAIDDLDHYFQDGQRPGIIVLADHAGDSEISRALKKGALGYVCKDVEPDELLKAIRAVAAGRRYLPPDIAGIVSEHIGQEELTSAEETVLRMIVGGMSNKEIGFALDISENTVKTHVQNIFGKIGVSDRTSAATTAIKRGLVRIDL